MAPVLYSTVYILLFPPAFKLQEEKRGKAPVGDEGVVHVDK